MDPCLLQRVGSTHIGHQVTSGENAADIGTGDLAAVGAQHSGTIGNTLCGQRNIVGNDDIICRAGFGNPYIRCVRTVIDNHKIDQRVRVWPYPAIADHNNAAFVANGNSGDFILHRTGIGINIDHHDPATIKQLGQLCILQRAEI